MQVHLDCIKVTCSPYYTKKQIDCWLESQTLQRYVSFIKKGEEFIVVVDERNHVIAFGHMGNRATEGLTDEVDFEVYGFYVSSSMQRKGVGSLLYGELEKRALAQGGCGIGVCSTLNAVSFYEACGFTVTADAIHEVSGKVELQTKLLEKKLSFGR